MVWTKIANSRVRHIWVCPKKCEELKCPHMGKGYLQVLDIAICLLDGIPHCPKDRPMVFSHIEIKGRVE
jgi:hypothetical protein